MRGGGGTCTDPVGCAIPGCCLQGDAGAQDTLGAGKTLVVADVAHICKLWSALSSQVQMLTSVYMPSYKTSSPPIDLLTIAISSTPRHPECSSPSASESSEAMLDQT